MWIATYVASKLGFILILILTYGASHERSLQSCVPPRQQSRQWSTDGRPEHAAILHVGRLIAPRFNLVIPE